MGGCFSKGGQQRPFRRDQNQVEALMESEKIVQSQVEKNFKQKNTGIIKKLYDHIVVSYEKQKTKNRKTSGRNVGNNREQEQMEEDQVGDSCGSKQKLVTVWSTEMKIGDEEKQTGLENA